MKHCQVPVRRKTHNDVTTQAAEQQNVNLKYRQVQSVKKRPTPPQKKIKKILSK